MAKYSLSEFEAWTIITQAVNFGMTQLVDGNWGMHALIPKSIFEGVERNPACAASVEESEEEDVTSAASRMNISIILASSFMVVFVMFI